MSMGADFSTGGLAIKIGGSLYDSTYLAEWLVAISKNLNKNIIVVPGGGPFADLVRVADEKFSLDHIHAHNMAVLAMQQFGNLLASLCPAFVLADSIEKIQDAWNGSKVVIWEPYAMVRDKCKLKKSWDVTSDSLAAWLAIELKINNLLLVKSSDEVSRHSDIKTLTSIGCLDTGFEEYVQYENINVVILHKTNAKYLQTLLEKT